MNRPTVTLLLALAGWVVWAGLTMGQEPSPMPIKSKPAPPPGAGDNDGSKLLTDPTTPSPKLREIMAAKAAGKALALPPVSLRGRVIAKGRPGLAVLEVDGKTVSVGRGSLLPGGVYRVKEVTSVEVILEVVGLKENISLR